MHSLKPITALGGHEPRTDVIGSVTISEIDTLALASIATRRGGKTATHKLMKKLIGEVPAPARASWKSDTFGFWMGPDQWMIAAPIETHETIADDLAAELGKAASVTEQSGAWAAFDITGDAMKDVCERLCAAPIRSMSTGDAQRSTVHQLGCFVVPMPEDNSVRIFGPRASAGSLHHAIVDAAKSVA